MCKFLVDNYVEIFSHQNNAIVRSRFYKVNHAESIYSV
jgi:hypothetical protein